MSLIHECEWSRRDQIFVAPDEVGGPRNGTRDQRAQKIQIVLHAIGAHLMLLQ
jgi:hypothetical protein